MGMGDVNIRKERIERLLSELRYEMTRGMLENEIEEEMGFRFVVPVSRNIPDGVVQCEFRTRPVPRGYAFMEATDGRLTVVKGGKSD